MSSGQATATGPMRKARAAHTSPLPARLALVAAGLAFGCGLVRLALHAWWALGYRYGLDYGEGVVWQQMRGIVAGHGYAPLRLLPAFVYEYPPVYHLVTHAVVHLGALDELLAGRLVSLGSMLASAVMIGMLATRAVGAGEDRPVRVVAGLCAALMFATLPVTLTWSVLMRVDMLACALTLAAALLTVRAAREPRWAVAAGLTFTAALYTKQTCLPGPAAAFVVLWIVRPRSAWLLLASAIGSGLVALVAAGGRDFLLHIVAYNINRVVWEHARQLAMVLCTNAVTLGLGAAGVALAAKRLQPLAWGTLRPRLAADPSLVAAALLVLMLGFKTLMLPAVLKSGASDNYLIDWFAPLAALAGVAVVPVIRAAIHGGVASPLLLMLLGIGVPAQMIDPPLRPDLAATAEQSAAADRVVARVRASAKPVVAEEDMTLLLRAGQPIVWEPAIVAELSSAGIYDERALARRVRRGEFGFFITSGGRGDTLYDQRFTPAMHAAIEAAYPRRERIGQFVLHLPS